MIPCTVIKDLLLLYEAGECSEDTKEIVEEHMKTCEQCRLAFDTLHKPSDLENQIEEKDENNIDTKKFGAKTVLKRMRRKWLTVLIIAVLIFPMIGTEVLVKNEVRKEGVCFSNLDDLYRCQEFLKAIQNKDYEKAFSYFNVMAKYEALMTSYSSNFDTEQVFQVEIAGEGWYIDESLYLNEYKKYLETGDDFTIWTSLLESNISYNYGTAIPKKAVTEEFIKQCRESGINCIIDDEIFTFGKDTYHLITDTTGEQFYYKGKIQDAADSEEIDAQLCMESRCISQETYESNKKKEEKDQETLDQYVEYYKSMGEETYIEKEKSYFLDNMKRFEEEGYSIDSFHLVPYAYYYESRRQWTITAYIKLDKNGEECEQDSMYETSKVQCQSDFDIDSSKEGILIHSSWFCNNYDNDFERAINYLGIAEDVDNYFQY